MSVRWALASAATVVAVGATSLTPQLAGSAPPSTTLDVLAGLTTTTVGSPAPVSPSSADGDVPATESAPLVDAIAAPPELPPVVPPVCPPEDTDPSVTTTTTVVETPDDTVDDPCAPESTLPPETTLLPGTTEPPVTDSPVTDPPVSDADGEPSTTPPVTEEPATTTAPSTSPTTAAPTTAAPTTAPVSSDAPTEVVPVAPPADAPIVELDAPAVEPPAHSGLSAVNYDGVYADGVPIGIAMMTSRILESGNRYYLPPNKGRASGAYQVITSTWNGYAGYPAAYLAPAEVQDQFAYEKFVAILKQYGNDVSKIPLIWYYPKALRDPALMDVVPLPQYGNVLTPRQYQTRWMQLFYELLGSGSPPFLPANNSAEPLIRSIAFPVLGPVSFINDWQFPRDGGRRWHEGNDMIGSTGQPLRAAVDGVVTRIRVRASGISGLAITITAADGYRYNYFHVNDDVPGGATGGAPDPLRIHPALAVGSMVKAGQVIAYMGDTGNAVGIPHLHFEIRTPDGTPVNPYPSLLAAQQREQCSTGIGPWSTVFDNRLPVTSVLDPEGAVVTPLAPAAPTTTAAPTTATRSRPRAVPSARSARSLPRWFETIEAAPESWTATGPDGAAWHITADGKVTATGVGALITPKQGGCTVVPEGQYGTDAKGLAAELLPSDWLAQNPTLLALAEAARRPERPVRPAVGAF